MRFALLFAFLIFAFGLVIRAFLMKFAAPKQEPKEIDAYFDEKPCAVDVSLHEHEWRQVTEFVRQCRRRECSKVEFMDGAPDGMVDYVNLMTTKQARVDPKREALIYADLDPRNWGLRCPSCNRVIGAPDDLPRNPHLIVTNGEIKTYHCPYCQALLIPTAGARGDLFYRKGVFPDESNHS